MPPNEALAKFLSLLTVPQVIVGLFVTVTVIGPADGDEALPFLYTPLAKFTLYVPVDVALTFALTVALVVPVPTLIPDTVQPLHVIALETLAFVNVPFVTKQVNETGIFSPTTPFAVDDPT